jgi:hypothetical protein
MISGRRRLVSDVGVTRWLTGHGGYTRLRARKKRRESKRGIQNQPQTCADTKRGKYVLGENRDEDALNA